MEYFGGDMSFVDTGPRLFTQVRLYGKPLQNGPILMVMVAGDLLARLIGSSVLKISMTRRR